MKLHMEILHFFTTSSLLHPLGIRLKSLRLERARAYIRKKHKENNYVSKLPRRQRLKPGPIVTATADRSSSVNFALSRASCTTCAKRASVMTENDKYI